MGRETHAAFTCENTFFLQFEIGCELGNRKMGREAQRLHLPVETECFVQLGISCELRNRKNMGWEADRRHLKWCFHNRVWRPKDVKTSESETVDGQHIQTLQQGLCWTRSPKSQCFSAPATKSDVKGLISFAHWGWRTSGYINIELWGVVTDRKGLNISSIYGMSTNVTK